MATIGDTNLTLMDLLKRQDPDGGLASIGDMMSQDQEVLKLIPFMEANDTTGHQITVDNALPAGTWRKLNAGTPDEKSNTVQLRESIGQLTTFLTVDRTLARLSGNVNKFRMMESKRAIEGLSQTLASTLIYGDTDINPERFLGLSPRYSLTSAANGVNIINEGDSSNLTSMWLVNFGEDTVHGIFPKGHTSGIDLQDLGEEVVSDASGNDYIAFRSYLEWNVGIAVRDWRHIVRIANIDTAAMVIDAATGPNLIDLMDRAVEQIKSTNGSPAFLVNKTIRSMLRRQAKNHSNVRLSLDNFDGKSVVHYDGIPILRTDAITSTETAVS